MDTSLHLSLNQQINLTPQLQQAIRLLQLSTIDLQDEIQQMLESNPMIEAIPNEDKDKLVTAEAAWDPFTFRNSVGSEKFDLENFYIATTTLREHLRWQLNLTNLSETDKLIAEALIDATNDDGFISLSGEEIMNYFTDFTFQLSINEIEAVRHVIQRFDPIGCASYNLTDSLLVQIDQFSSDCLLKTAKEILINDIHLLAERNYSKIKKKYLLTTSQIEEIVVLVQKLNPKPGSLIQNYRSEFIIPDVIVKKVNNQWQLSLNSSTLPELRIHKQYANLIQRGNDSKDNLFLKKNLQEAKWFIKSIKSRQDTLLQVAKCIISYQKEFLEYGDQAMKPLILNDIANALNMHESTISRVTTQKFIHTPKGIFELKYFFSSHVVTKSGEMCSSTAIKAIIKQLIAKETLEKPFSDHKIAELMKQNGINIARRTIAKYRDILGILPSHERKKFKHI